MTALTYVTKREMEQRTGFKKALGYSFPKKDEILIRKGLPKEVEKKVKQHEEEHIKKGEEGPILGSIIGGIASIASGLIGSRSAKKAASTAAQGSERELEYLRESRDLARSDQGPYREAGYTALNALMDMTGLSQPRDPASLRANARQDERVRQRAIARGEPVASDYLRGFGGRSGRRLQSRNYGGAIHGRAYGGQIYNEPRYGWGGPVKQIDYNVNETGPENVFQGGSVTRNSNPQTISPTSTGYVSPNENPGGVAGGFNFQKDPGYEFRLGEGQRTLERGAAAAGGLLSGGYARRAMRYGQDYASAEYTNVYNRIANIAGLGQVSANQSGNAALMAGQGMGTAAAQGAYASAYGQQASGNAWANAANQIGQLPWDEIFKGSGGDYDPSVPRY
jgi:hypothetical protein